jgi:hypothetical protein
LVFFHISLAHQTQSEDFFCFAREYQELFFSRLKKPTNTVKIFLGFGRASKRILSSITPPTNKAKICALELPEHQEFLLL